MALIMRYIDSFNRYMDSHGGKFIISNALNTKFIYFLILKVF